MSGMEKWIGTDYYCIHPNNRSEWTIIRWVQNKGPYSHSIKPWNSLLQTTVDANKEKKNQPHTVFKKPPQKKAQNFTEKAFH